MVSRVGLLFLLCLALPARAQEVRDFTLTAAPEIIESGLLDYIMPRFALKTGRRGTLVDDGADLRLGADVDGAPVMVRGDTAYTLVLATDNDAAQRFADWLQSDIGQNTLTAFEPAEGPSFAAAAAMAEAEEIAFEGDAELGREVAETHCARCHRVTAETTRMGIGSTPSFGALKALPDWSERFSIFYVLNPHPAFLLVAGISPPFDPERPPPIVPVELTQEEVEALQAFAAELPAADLGADIVSQ